MSRFRLVKARSFHRSSRLRPPAFFIRLPSFRTLVCASERASSFPAIIFLICVSSWSSVAIISPAQGRYSLRARPDSLYTSPSHAVGSPANAPHAATIGKPLNTAQMASERAIERDLGGATVLVGAMSSLHATAGHGVHVS